MVKCNGFDCCPPEVQALAIIGGIIVYAFIGFLVGTLVRELTKNSREMSEEDKKALAIFAAVLWPLAIVVLILLPILYWFLFPLIGATRQDVRNSEERLSEKIESTCTPVAPVETSEDLFGEGPVEPPFIPGDIITGVQGNPDGYKVLYGGCFCRVLSINDKGSMKLLLLDHLDRDAHQEKIGNTYTAPARNFVLIKDKKKAKKRTVKKSSKKSVKKVSRKKSSRSKKR